MVTKTTTVITRNTTLSQDIQKSRCATASLTALSYQYHVRPFDYPLLVLKIQSTEALSYQSQYPCMENKGLVSKTYSKVVDRSFTYTYFA